MAKICDSSDRYCPEGDTVCCIMCYYFGSCKHTCDLDNEVCCDCEEVE